MKAIYTNALSLAYPIDIFRTIYYSLTDTLSPSNTAMYLLSNHSFIQINTSKRE